MRLLRRARISRWQTAEEDVVNYKPQVYRICEAVVVEITSCGGTSSILWIGAAEEDRVDLLPKVNCVNKRVRIQVTLERTLAITHIANVVPVRVCLVWIVSGRTIVAKIANTIAIGIRHTGVC